MWLPKPIYEALPTVYMVIGVVFLGGAAYLGASHDAAAVYGGVGVICLLSGIFVRTRRHESRTGKSSTSADDSNG